MSSTKRRPAVRSPQAASQRSLTPEEQARDALESRHYRAAVEHYKTLLKQEQRQEWIDGLAESYAGRADELAAKGLFAEALVVWRNRSQACDRPLADGPYLGWLLRAGDYVAALSLLGKGDGLAQNSAGDLEARLAAVALTAPADALAQLAADSPLIRHRAAALAAIAACCRGDQLALDEQLRAIPFRSPYRDLRFILKSLALLAADPAQATDLIARVAVDGPFETLAAVVRAAVLPGRHWLGALLDLAEDGRRLLLEIKGCPENRRAAVLEVAQLARLQESPAPGKVVDLILRRRRTLPASAAALCRRLLPYASKRLAEYQNAFGALAGAERECIAALSAELQKDLVESEEHWLRAVASLGTSDRSPLPAALILRHLFDMFVGGDDEDPQNIDSICMDWLERSLTLDPEDRGTHLKLIRIQRSARDLRAARASVAQAMASFPNDPAVLLEAVETALAGNAFKKAVGLAKRVLELDPINSRVRALIGQAHVSYARKQIRAQRPDAASKELDQAEQWLSAPSERSVVKLLRGLSSTDQAARALLRDAVAAFDGPLLAAFHVLLESARLGLAAPTTLTLAGIDLSAKATVSEVLAVVHALNAAPADVGTALGTTLAGLQQPLRRAARMDFSESERVSICEALLRRREASLLQAFADAGLKRWPKRPLFVYFRVFSRYGGAACFGISDADEKALLQALDTARTEGDQRTALRIEDLLSPPGAFDDDDDDDDSELDDAFGDFANGMADDPRAMLEMMLKVAGADAVIEMVRANLPANLFREFERTAGRNRDKLARLLIEVISEAQPPPTKPRVRDKLPPPAPRSPRSAQPKPPTPDDRQKDLFDD